MISETKTKDNPLVSVLITIYNVDKYLEECLDSIINQSYKNIEIICVNNGSLDKCADILERYRIIDNRIKVITLKNNKKLCTGRNISLDNSTGDLLMFVDPDDLIGKDYIKTFVTSYIKKNNKHDGLVINPNTVNFVSSDKIRNNLNLTGVEYHDLSLDINKTDSVIYKNEVDFYPPTELAIPMWGRLYDAFLIKSNKIRFADGEMIDNLPFTALCAHFMEKWYCMGHTFSPDERYYRRINSLNFSDEIQADPSGCGSITSSVLFNSISIVDCMNKWIKGAPDFILPLSDIFISVYMRHRFRPFIFDEFKKLINNNRDYFINNSPRFDRLSLDIINSVIGSNFSEFNNYIFPQLANRYQAHFRKDEKLEKKALFVKKSIYLFNVLELLKTKIYSDYTKYYLFGLPFAKKERKGSFLFFYFLGIKLIKIKY